MLMDHADAVPERILRGTDNHFLTVYEDGTVIRIVDAGDHVHKGGFSAAVLAQNRKNLTSVNGKIHVFVGDQTAERLRDLFHLQSNLLVHEAPPIDK